MNILCRLFGHNWFIKHPRLKAWQDKPEKGAPCKRKGCEEVF